MRKARNVGKSLYDTSPVNPSQPCGHNRPDATLRLAITSSLYIYKTEIVREKHRCFLIKLVTPWLLLPLCVHCSSCVSTILLHPLHLRILSPFLLSLHSVAFNHFRSEIQRGDFLPSDESRSIVFASRSSNHPSLSSGNNSSNIKSKVQH